MSSRISSEWLWCILAIYMGSLLTPAHTNSVRQPPSNPSTVEAQAKFFQDFFSVQLSPYKIEFGHVCEDPNTWEQRYEKKDFKNHRDMGKVRWGDKKGGYGEHYWDLNHAGHTNDHGHDHDDYDRNHVDGDDGSYHEDNNDPYDEPSDNSPTYGTEEYDPEKASYEDNGRAKRAHPKVKVERHFDTENEKRKRRNNRVPTTRQTENKNKSNQSYEEPNSKENSDFQENSDLQKQKGKDSEEKKEVVLVFTHKDKDQGKETKEQQNFERERLPQVNRANHYVPYENGAGVRGHEHPEATAAASVPRLFLEPSTGHVVDRATGQAYILQPIRNQYLES